MSMFEKFDEIFEVTARVEAALAAFKAGEFLLVSDDEDRENEGDLIIAAEHATPEAINFMITHGRGLVCIAITKAIAERHGLCPMVAQNGDHMGTAFTQRVDGTPAYGVSTGISAHDRARTIALLLDEHAPTDCLQAPGHMFPLVARPGGLRERQGHTEAAVELARLCGLKPAGVIVEVINDDGTMARRPDLLAFAERHRLHYITIKDLCMYTDAMAAPMLQEAPSANEGNRTVAV